MGAYRLRVPASCVGYVPEAQGGLPPGPRVLYVLATRTSHGRTVCTAYGGTPGEPKGGCTGSDALWERFPVQSLSGQPGWQDVVNWAGMHDRTWVLEVSPIGCDASVGNP